MEPRVSNSVSNSKIVRSTLFDALPWVQYFFGCASEPKLDWTLPQWKQVHGGNLAFVQNAQQNCGEVDALWTNIPKTPIAVVTADCVPLLFARQAGNDRSVLAIHAGWRGTHNHIVEQILDSLKNPGSWTAVIGPCIRACCYEVESDLIKSFLQTFPNLKPQTVTPNHRKLDLANVHAAVLRNLGIKNVEVLPYCTHCSQHPTFNSYRRDKTKNRQYSMIMLG